MTDLSPGDLVGGFIIESALGSGGMATVYRARDPALDRSVAIKLVNPLALGADGMLRFQREAELAARVDADGGVVRVHARGQHRGAPFLVLELVAGRDLAAIFKDGPIEAIRLARFLEAVARTIDRCHRAGVVHRDLKPGNILVRAEDDTPLVADFGLARDVAADRLTQTGVLLGTPAYMAPEQALDAARAVDPRVDVYALGAILYHGLAGQPPFGSGLAAIMRAAQEDPPAPSSLASGVDPSLEAICLRALARDPARRQASAAELADDLARWRAGARPVRGARRMSVAAGTSAVVAVIVGGAAIHASRAAARRDDVARAVIEVRALETTLEALIAAPHEGPTPSVDLVGLQSLEERLARADDDPEVEVARERVEALRCALTERAAAPTPPGDPLARAVSAWAVWRGAGPGAALERLGDAGRRHGSVALFEIQLRIEASSSPLDLVRLVTPHRTYHAIWPAKRPRVLAALMAAYRHAATSWDLEGMTALATAAAALERSLPTEALDAVLQPWRARILQDLASESGELETAARLQVLLGRSRAGPSLRNLLVSVYVHFNALDAADVGWERPLAWDDAVSRLDPSFEAPDQHCRRLRQMVGIKELRDEIPATFALSCVRRGVFRRAGVAITDLARYLRPNHEARLEQDGGGAARLCLAALVMDRHDEASAVRRALETALHATPPDISPAYSVEARVYLARLCLDLAKREVQGPSRVRGLREAAEMASSTIAEAHDTSLRWSAVDVMDDATREEGTPPDARVRLLLPLVASDPLALDRLLDRYDDVVTQDASTCESAISTCVRAVRLARAQTLLARARAQHVGLAETWDELQRHIDATQ